MNQFLVVLCVIAVASGKPCGGNKRTQSYAPGAAPAQAAVKSAPVPVVQRQAVKNIPNVATEIGASTLVDLVVKAGLADALSGPGPFTVFAPTNEAFAALPKETLAKLLEDKELLKKVLLFHVVSGEVPSSALKNDITAASLQGAKVRINIYGDVITADGAQVIRPDVRASNGIIHVVNQVLFPVAESDITAVLINDPQQRFTTLVTAVKEAGLVETLQSEGPFTLFAPTNDAFAALPEGTLAGLLKDKDALKGVLLGHVVSGTVYARGVPAEGTVPAVRSGAQINLRSSAAGVQVNDATVLQADLPATNGVIHVISKVI